MRMPRSVKLWSQLRYDYDTRLRQRYYKELIRCRSLVVVSYRNNCDHSLTSSCIAPTRYAAPPTTAFICWDLFILTSDELLKNFYRL